MTEQDVKNAVASAHQGAEAGTPQPAAIMRAGISVKAAAEMATNGLLSQAEAAQTLSEAGALLLSLGQHMSRKGVGGGKA